MQYKQKAMGFTSGVCLGYEEGAEKKILSPLMFF
jgi:hypothetical protein